MMLWLMDDPEDILGETDKLISRFREKHDLSPEFIRINPKIPVFSFEGIHIETDQYVLPRHLVAGVKT